MGVRLISVCKCVCVSICWIELPILHLGPVHPFEHEHFTNSGPVSVFSQVPQPQKSLGFVSHGATIYFHTD